MDYAQPQAMNLVKGEEIIITLRETDGFFHTDRDKTKTVNAVFYNLDERYLQYRIGNEKTGKPLFYIMGLERITGQQHRQARTRQSH